MPDVKKLSPADLEKAPTEVLEMLARLIRSILAERKRAGTPTAEAAS